MINSLNKYTSHSGGSRICQWGQTMASVQSYNGGLRAEPPPGS